MKKVELLAPAGNYEGFLGALHAGADAIYLGGEKFSARAYADNFTNAEVCKAIKYAHLFQRKVYLTVNTLVKDSELLEMIDYIKPFYESGLDGVIVQDMGVFLLLRENFPFLELHVSTQMAITGPLGSRFLKELGAVRVVPARELSLAEIRDIKKEVAIEVETFIHGAMCYSYSGNCLFSSLLGGRSGNRGRCAGPCRLPYQVNGVDTKNESNKEVYPLSLKDMCALNLIPSLIESQIDSFKIEGRMKKPEYTAGVTALYRKYIDLYYEKGSKNFNVSQKDYERLTQLYMRSDIQDGYYNRRNGNEMITLQKPSYSKVDERLLQSIRQDYMDEKMMYQIDAFVTLKPNEPISLTIMDDSYQTVTEYGDVVLEAQNKPLDVDTIQKQLSKTRDTAFQFRTIEINMEGNCFLPVKSLNELRRKAIDSFEDLLTKEYILTKVQTTSTISDYQIFNQSSKDFISMENSDENTSSCMDVSVLQYSQWDACVTNTSVKRIYIDYDNVFCSLNMDKMKNTVANHKELYISLPSVIRKNNRNKLQEISTALENPLIEGVLVKNLEEIEWLRSISYSKDVVLDANMYCFNQNTLDFWTRLGASVTIPYELNKYEIDKLAIKQGTIICYGNIPVMYTANCVRKTSLGCSKAMNHNNSFITITDRYKKKFPVYIDCENCNNVIYNSIPLSLHQYLAQLIKKSIRVRLDFTIETKEQTFEVLSYYQKLIDTRNISKKINISPLPSYLENNFTNGHYKRGVE